MLGARQQPRFWPELQTAHACPFDSPAGRLALDDSWPVAQGSHKPAIGLLSAAQVSGEGRRVPFGVGTGRAAFGWHRLSAMVHGPAGGLQALHAACPCTPACPHGSDLPASARHKDGLQAFTLDHAQGKSMHSGLLLPSLTVHWGGAQCCGNAGAAAALKAWLRKWQYTPPAQRGKRAVDEYGEELAWSDVSACLDLVRPGI